jgi:hypothetical protein
MTNKSIKSIYITGNFGMIFFKNFKKLQKIGKIVLADAGKW